MSHLIIKPYDVVYAPESGENSSTWHGLQTNVRGLILPDGSNIPDVFCPIVEAGFKPDFDSPLSTMPAELAAELKENPISDWKVILADLRNHSEKLGVVPLHVAKSGYKVHQNKALFDSMVGAAIEVLGKEQFEIATVGTLGACSQFFVSIAIKGQYEGFNVGKKEKDAWKSFFNLVSSHNSLVASQTLLSVIRIVCMNTVQASISDAENTGLRASIKHTVNSEALITAKQFETNLRAWLTKREAFAAMCEYLRGKPMSVEQFKNFSAGVFTQENSDALSTTSYNRIEELTEKFQRGAGNQGKNRYDALNAWTETFTRGNALGDPDRVSQSKRIASANFGRGNDWKLEAIRCLEVDNYEATVKRGARYYEDKHKEMMAGN